MRAFAFVTLLLMAISPARAQWAGQCPTGVAPSSVGCQPMAATPLATDLVLGWQVNQSPKTRAIQVQQLLNASLPGTFSTFTATGLATLNGGGALAGTFTGTPAFSGQVAFSKLAGTGINVTAGALIGGALGVTGATTLNGGAALSGGGSLSGTYTGTPTFSQNISFTRNLTHQDSSGFNITSQNILDPASLWEFDVVFAKNAGGSGSPLAGPLSYVHSYNINDQVSVNGAMYGWSWSHNIVSGAVASGVRGTAVFLFVQQAGATVTNGGINTALGSGAWSGTNNGGTATNYLGAMNPLNTTGRLLTGATFMQGMSGFESDLGAQTGTSYMGMEHLLLVNLSDHQTKGYSNNNAFMIAAAQAGALADMVYGIKWGDQNSALAFDPFGRFMFASKGLSNTMSTLAAGIDIANVTVQAFTVKAPFTQEVPLQATAITGVTRLTSDGAAPSSFVYDMIRTGAGTGYTAFPTITASAGTGVVLHGGLGSGGTLAQLGVYNPGTLVPAETTAAVSGGGGSGGTVQLIIAGNTLNFPINSTVFVTVYLTATTLTHSGTDACAWTISFVATMGATASTTTILGSPTWTLISETTGAAAKFSGSSPAVPAADVTLGAINLSITPTTGTWDIGGYVRMVKSSRAR